MYFSRNDNHLSIPLSYKEHPDFPVPLPRKASRSYHVGQRVVERITIPAETCFTNPLLRSRSRSCGAQVPFLAMLER